MIGRFRCQSPHRDDEKTDGSGGSRAVKCPHYFHLVDLLDLLACYFTCGWKLRWGRRGAIVIDSIINRSDVLCQAEHFPEALRQHVPTPDLPTSFIRSFIIDDSRVWLEVIIDAKSVIRENMIYSWQEKGVYIYIRGKKRGLPSLSAQ